MSDHLSQWQVRNRPANTPLFGLCAFETSIPVSQSLSDAIFSIGVGEYQAKFPSKAIVERSSDTTARALFHLQTHMFPNGQHQIRVSLEWPDGTVWSWSDTPVEIDNTGALSASVTKDLKAFGAAKVFGHVVDSSMFPYGAGRAIAWFNEPVKGELPHLSFEPAPDNESARQHLQRWGFCVLKDMIPAELIASFNVEIDEAVANGTLSYREGSSERIYGAHKLTSGTKIWLFPSVLRFLRDWFQDEPCACQSLLYINGSEQKAHQDTIHLTPYPAGYMCGVWIALEDVKENSGELFVYPGSQHTPRLTASGLHLAKVRDDYSSYVTFDNRIAELLQQGGYEIATYRPKAGQILVWHENLIHGGSKRLNTDINRRSIVSHYFTRGSIAYYDSRGEAAFLEPVF
jgi:ectoine hydroxylase-related dioxygenase (phytanoyl-CoA dioxygenase family)